MTSQATTPEGYLVNSSGFLPPNERVARHIIDFLQWRFSQLPAGAYRWDPASDVTPKQTGSEIYIAHETPVTPENVGARPAVTAMVGTLQFQGVGIGDLAYTDLDTGAKVRMDFAPTALRVNVLSRVPVEAQRLAWFIGEQIWMFRDPIVKLEPCLLYTGQRPMISEPTPAGSLIAPSTEHEWCAVVVQFPTFIQHAATSLPMGQRILNHLDYSAKLPQTK